MTKASDNVFPKVEFAEGAAPSTPASGQVKLYAKTDGLLYSKDDAGVESSLGGSGTVGDHNHDGSGGSGGDLDAPVIDGYAVFNEEAAPSTPSTGTVAVYAKADGLMYSKDDAGVETAMSSGGTADHNHDGSGGSGGDLDAPVIDGYAIFNEEAAPSTPASGTVAIYAKSDGRIYSKDDAGVEYGPFDAASGGGGVPTGFPWIDHTNIATTQVSANSTSHVINLPSGITAGKLLIILMGVDGNGTISATGWTALTGANSSGNCSTGILYKFASGSEGATVTVTVSASEESQAIAFMVEDAHASSPPENANSSAGTAESIMSSPTLTPSWGADDTLWISICSQDASSGATAQLHAQPIQYIYLGELDPANTGHVLLGAAYRWLNAASEDPRNFHSSVAEQYAATTIAVRPV